MKGTQRERTVRDEAARWLCDQLRTRPTVASARHWIECRVHPSSKEGRGQADAVIAALKKDETHYTITLEAKSIRTLRALRGKSGRTAQFLASLLIGAVASVIIVRATDSSWALVVALGFLMTCLSFVSLRALRVFSALAPVVQQLMQYPGNEHWIAVPEDAVSKSGSDFETLLADCSAAGIGLLGVSRRKKAQVYVEARQDRSTGPKLREYIKAEGFLQDLLSLKPCPHDGHPR